MNNTAILLREATLSDAPAIQAIYAPYVENTTVTFEYEPPTVAEMAARMEAGFYEYPYLVCQQNDRVVGYGYAHQLFVRAAYAWNAELSIYVDQACRAQGIGTRMLAALLEILRHQNVQWAYSIIALPNEPSERLHLAHGFHLCAQFPNAGFKLGQWHDTAWYAKPLGKAEVPPAPLIPFAQLPKPLVNEILQG